MKKACFFAALVIGGLSTLCCAYSGGDGSSGNPYQIADANDLNAIGLHSEDWGKCFILTDDIDMSVFTGTQYNIIGNYTTKFTGTFDGNGYVIQNLTYSTTDVVHYVGLFGVTSNATIQNLGLENVLIASGGSQIGGIVGNNSGKISNSYASGTVIGRFYIGGLVGYNSGVINNCYSTDIVNGSSDSNYIGGLIGYNQAGTVKLCYSAGFVSGYSFVGGFIGYKSGGTIENCFWDIQTSGQSGSDGGTGKTTVEMMTRSTFVSAGWDFSSRWIDGDFQDWCLFAEGVEYPKLKWQCPQSYHGGSGTVSDPYQIEDNNDLLTLADNPADYTKSFILIKDIDLEGRSFVDAVIAPDTTAMDKYFEGTAFTGTFDGNGYKIAHFTINRAGLYLGYIGLFGYTHLATIKNLGIEDFTITGAGESWFVGGLAGYSYNSCISNSYTIGTVSGAGAVGGLIGKNEGYIANCYSKCTVSGENFIGGLVGFNKDGDIHGCFSTGIVNGTYAVGGFLGGNLGVVVGSYWDIETSGQTTSYGGTGKTTEEMQTLSTFTLAGWDFTNETANGTNDIWRMCGDGVDYPRLNWESIDGDFACPDGVSIEDLDYFVGRWLLDNCTSDNNYCGGADADLSSTVDLADYAILAQHWLEGV